MKDYTSKSFEIEADIHDPCEYNPKEKRACYSDEVHAKADFLVGSKGRWRLCKSCSELPEFKRLKKYKIKRENI